MIFSLKVYYVFRLYCCTASETLFLGSIEFDVVDEIINLQLQVQFELQGRLVKMDRACILSKKICLHPNR